MSGSRFICPNNFQRFSIYRDRSCTTTMVEIFALGKLATHDVLKMTHLTKTAPIFTFSLPCNSV